MAVRIFPCHGCPLRSGCHQRTELSSQVSGFGLGSAAFRCMWIEAELRRGLRVVMRHPYTLYGSVTSEDYEITHLEVPATIHSVRPHYRPSVIVDLDAPRPDADRIVLSDDELNKRRFRRAMPHTRIIRFLDEPDKLVCASGRILLPTGECDRLDWPDNVGPCECQDAQSRG